jgi:hypothetical protein
VSGVTWRKHRRQHLARQQERLARQRAWHAINRDRATDRLAWLDAQLAKIAAEMAELDREGPA